MPVPSSASFFQYTHHLSSVMSKPTQYCLSCFLSKPSNLSSLHLIMCFLLWLTCWFIPCCRRPCWQRPHNTAATQHDRGVFYTDQRSRKHRTGFTLIGNSTSFDACTPLTYVGLWCTLDVNPWSGIILEASMFAMAGMINIAVHIWSLWQLPILRMVTCSSFPLYCRQCEVTSR